MGSCENMKSEKRLIVAEDFCSRIRFRRLGLGIGKSKVQRLHSHVGDSIQQVPLEIDFDFIKYGIHQQSSMYLLSIYEYEILLMECSESKIS